MTLVVDAAGQMCLADEPCAGWVSSKTWLRCTSTVMSGVVSAAGSAAAASAIVAYLGSPLGARSALLGQFWAASALARRGKGSLWFWLLRGRGAPAKGSRRRRYVYTSSRWSTAPRSRGNRRCSRVSHGNEAWRSSGGLGYLGYMALTLRGGASPAAPGHACLGAETCGPGRRNFAGPRGAPTGPASSQCTRVEPLGVPARGGASSISDSL